MFATDEQQTTRKMLKKQDRVTKNWKVERPSATPNTGCCTPNPSLHGHSLPVLFLGQASTERQRPVRPCESHTVDVQVRAVDPSRSQIRSMDLHTVSSSLNVPTDCSGPSAPLCPTPVTVHIMCPSAHPCPAADGMHTCVHICVRGHLVCLCMSLCAYVVCVLLVCMYCVWARVACVLCVVLHCVHVCAYCVICSFVCFVLHCVLVCTCAYCVLCEHICVVYMSCMLCTCSLCCVCCACVHCVLGVFCVCCVGCQGRQNAQQKGVSVAAQPGD